MKVKIWKLGEFDGEVEVSYGATVAEVMDAANLRFGNATPIVNGLDAHLGMTLRNGDMVCIVPLISVIRHNQKNQLPVAANEEELDSLFLRGAINLTEYSRRLSAVEAETHRQSLVGATIVLPRAA